MTVEQLIKELEKYNKKAEVLVFEESGDTNFEVLNVIEEDGEILLEFREE